MTQCLTASGPCWPVTSQAPAAEMLPAGRANAPRELPACHAASSLSSARLHERHHAPRDQHPASASASLSSSSSRFPGHGVPLRRRCRAQDVHAASACLRGLGLRDRAAGLPGPAASAPASAAAGGANVAVGGAGGAWAHGAWAGGASADARAPAAVRFPPLEEASWSRVLDGGCVPYRGAGVAPLVWKQPMARMRWGRITSLPGTTPAAVPMQAALSQNG
eukprot:CAMPEP_0168394456 /NCGR_PEP_ID=MMETSP0228-20121227/19543_1 /TAXON_ID=133427 /ORGANISM="Protoceratium reticulatum, Strain CCCM 535 (=CCMP 1889)" /LENGTH=220 /DNA_ID=CAMNT_0008407869 /DNA_START=378 /DNA_END=1037 /DNA_ORIENTATION=+